MDNDDSSTSPPPMTNDAAQRLAMLALAMLSDSGDDRDSKQTLPIKVVFVLGAPGSGKGTLCKGHPVKSFGYYHLSVGDYLRQLCNSGDDSPSEARGGKSTADLKECLATAGLVSAKEIVAMLLFKINKELENGNSRFIIDGFPRTIESAELFEQEVAKPETVLLVDCPRDLAKGRFVARGRETSDNESKFDTRYEQFQEINPKLCERYADVLKTIDTNCDLAVSNEVFFQYLMGVELEL